MIKEISKGTQKFIWHLAVFVAVFVLVLVILAKILPEPTRTSNVNQLQQTQKTDYSTDFEWVKERVDEANNTIGEEIEDLYSSEGKSTIQKQLETRLFFDTIKSSLICALMLTVIVVLLKKRLNTKKIKKMFNGDAFEEDESVKEHISTDRDKIDIDVSEKVSEAAEEEPELDEEPPLEEKESDEEEVFENCKL